MVEPRVDPIFEDVASLEDKSKDSELSDHENLDTSQSPSVSPQSMSITQMQTSALDHTTEESPGKRKDEAIPENILSQLDDEKKENDRVLIEGQDPEAPPSEPDFETEQATDIITQDLFYQILADVISEPVPHR